MSAQPKPQSDIDERLAAFDAMFDEPASSSPTPLTDQPLEPPAPFIAAQEPVKDESDVVQAMQQLLLAHEDTQLHRVEDPDLVRVLDELRMLAHSNIADVFTCEEVLEYIGKDEDENDIYEKTKRLRVQDITQLPREVSACIQSVKVTSGPKGDTVDIKMYDKQVSLDKLMRFHGAYMRDNEQQGVSNDNIMDLLLSSIGSQGMPTIDNNDA